MVDDGLRSKLAEAGVTEQPPHEICLNCYGQFNLHVSSGSKLVARERAREDKKQMMWKQRVALIRRGRAAMEHKLLADAATSYEKYLRLMELVFDAKKGDLQPEHFKESARTQELTVVASVYWDLLRIYDSNPKYRDRQMEVATQLAQFLRYTPVFPDIVKKANAFAKTCKNPQAVKHFLKASKAKRPRCFIATSAFGDPLAPEVQILAWYRDYHLTQNAFGRGIIRIYYLISPAIAKTLDKIPELKMPLRWILQKLAARLIEG